MVLDNVYWKGPKRKELFGKEHGGYEGRLTDRQLQFTANYLQVVPKDDRVIVCTHIPLPEIGHGGSQNGTPQFRRLLEILSDHPHTMSFSAHTHINHHEFAGAEQGYTPEAATEHHHHNVATGSGSWYRGPLDEQGFPVTTMADGAPNGYILATFQGNEYRLRYKGARKPANYQLAIHAPEVVSSERSDAAEVVVNVFNGNERSRVRMRVRGHGDWTRMEQSPRTDPAYAAAQERDVVVAGDRRKPLPEPKLTEHIWVAKLPAGLSVGMHVLEVEATDMFSQTDRGIRIVEVE
ncbi:MAG: calcineurin-like phosphoesterase C-terminal domain-containing protein [Planctomycetes bacterium]|nr:calcineurin-like phosphoesterase C-terminal domain-containing protein [Planctomycetota bacterium]